MNVLSLFDGMSCGQIALMRLGIKVDNYFASEIDEYGIQITQLRYPDTIQLGDVKQIKGADLPKIDLLIGGSPCQGFSSSGHNLNFADPRSALFFEFVRLMKECKPDHFLLENVPMKQEWANIISSYLKVSPILINSSYTSAQMRRRLYWTNIPYTKPKATKHLYIRDILHKRPQPDLVRALPLDKALKFKLPNQMTLGLPAMKYEVGKRSVNRIVLVGKIGKGTQGQVIYGMNGKAPTLIACHAKDVYIALPESDDKVLYYRQLTPVECERLQTVGDNYTFGVSNTQRYAMLGNGWTVDVIKHLLSPLK